jgi:hypothetical protein
MDDTVLVNTITGILPGPDGLLYVTQRQEATVTVLTLEGRLVRRFGARGDGPGEFQSVSGLGFRHDSLWVMDNQLGRLSWFGLNGEFLVSEVQQSRDLRPTAAGGWIGMRALWVEATETTIQFKAPGQSEPTVLHRLPWTRGGFRIDMGRGTARVGAHPLSDAPRAAFHPNGQGLTVIESPPSGGEVRITRYSAEGQRSLEASATLDAPPVTAEQWDAFLARFFNPPLPAAITRSQLDAVLARPERWPPVSAVLQSVDDWLWIRGPAADTATSRWTMLDPEARPMGTISLPATLRILHVAGDTIWAVRPDVDDLDIVTQYIRHRHTPPQS